MSLCNLNLGRVFFPTAVAVLGACSGSIDPGPRVQVELAELDTSAGESVAIEQAWLTTWSITLEVCATQTSKHGLDAPNRVSAVTVENVADSTSFGPIGELAPVPADYCGVTIEALPADEDALGASPEQQLGISARLTGLRDGIPFSAETAATFTHRIDFANPVTLRPADQWLLTVTRDPNAWLLDDGLDWTDAAALGRTALQDSLWTAFVTMDEVTEG